MSETAGEREHARAPPGFRDRNCKRRARRGGDRDRQRGRIDVGARALDQRLDEVRIASDECAEAAESLAERADEGRHFARREPEMLERAGAGFAQDPEPVRVVHGEEGAVSRAGGCDRGQRREVAIHAEDAVRQHERAGRVRGELALERSGVAVRIVSMAARAMRPASISDAWLRRSPRTAPPSGPAPSQAPGLPCSPSRRAGRASRPVNAASSSSRASCSPW